MQWLSLKRERQERTDAKSWKVSLGDFKFNVELEWPEMKTSLVKTGGAFFDLRIEIKTENGISRATFKNNTTYEVVGTQNICYFPNRYHAFDEESKSMTLTTM
eukprot:scaffold18043_cov46-Attheya_sp.AAC.1